MKQAFDLVTRLYVDLPKFSTDNLIELVELCLEQIRSDNVKSIAWKDLLPEVLTLVSAMPNIIVNGIPMAGSDFRRDTIRNIITMKWQNGTLTPLANMFR